MQRKGLLLQSKIQTKPHLRKFNNFSVSNQENSEKFHFWIMGTEFFWMMGTEFWNHWTEFLDHGDGVLESLDGVLDTFFVFNLWMILSSSLVSAV